MHLKIFGIRGCKSMCKSSTVADICLQCSNINANGLAVTLHGTSFPSGNALDAIVLL